MEYHCLYFEREDHVALVTIDRPSVLNALNAFTISELTALFEKLAYNKEEKVRAIVLTGAGDRAFVAGADIVELQAINSAAAAEDLSRRGQRLCALIEAAGVPVIAAINGFALGGGCELALACDFRIASDISRFGQPEVGLGIIPGWGGTFRLPRIVGISAAKRLILDGEIIDASEALRLGLVDRVVPSVELLNAAKKWAHRLAERSPVAMSAAKRAIVLSEWPESGQRNILESALFAAVCTSRDRVEGVSAYLEKRQPKFDGN
jgi:enoyl-CoA hydratase